MIVEEHWCQYSGYMDNTFQFGVRYEQGNKQLPESEFIFEFTYYGCRSFNEIWTSLTIGNIKFTFYPYGTISLNRYSESAKRYVDTGIRFQGTPKDFINSHVCHHKDDLLWWYKKCLHKFEAIIPEKIKELQELM